ncbi:MAG: KEOPS complex kinase/ATPase Bud32, partial [Candidatus Ranarchaeia archaeon]
MLFKQGAEANLYLEEWFGKKVVRKHRIAKSYRHPLLDKRLRQQRTRHEARLIAEARELGIPTPIIYLVNTIDNTLILQYIDAPKLKDEIPTLTEMELREVFVELGRLIGRLHKARIAHGDITTSNLLLSNETIVFLDFGLAHHVPEDEIEPLGVDLHLLQRVLDSTHHSVAAQCFRFVIQGYKK